MNDLGAVKRALYIPGTDRSENDAEHSFQVAFMALALIKVKNLPLDLELVLSYALVHDICEAITGDVDVFDVVGREMKVTREQEALKLLRQSHPELHLIWDLVEAYEHRRDPESQFVSSVDKLLPILNAWHDGGRPWREKGATLDRLLELKRNSFPDQHIQEIFSQLVTLLRERENELFASSGKDRK